MLEKGDKPIALVTIDGNGKLSAFDDLSNPISHWVWVQDMITTKSGETLVRLYNPFSNKEEIYSWDEFSTAWNKTGGKNGKKYEHSGHYQAVVISYDEE